MRIIITGCTALDYTLEMRSFAVHLSAHCKTMSMVLMTSDRTLTTPGHQVLCLLLLPLPHLVLLYPCRTLEPTLKPLRSDPELKVHGRHMMTSIPEKQNH